MKFREIVEVSKFKPKFHSGEPVDFTYRSAKNVKTGGKELPGEVVGHEHVGSSAASTVDDVMPQKPYRHKGEKLPIHRHETKLRKR